MVHLQTIETNTWNVPWLHICADYLWFKPEEGGGDGRNQYERVEVLATD